MQSVAALRDAHLRAVLDGDRAAARALPELIERRDEAIDTSLERTLAAERG